MESVSSPPDQHAEWTQPFILDYENVKCKETSLKWLTVAMPLLENSKRQERDKTRVRLERDKRETREIWSYGGWPIIV